MEWSSTMRYESLNVRGWTYDVKRAMTVLVLSLIISATIDGAPSATSVTGAKKYKCGKILTGQGLIISSDYLPPVANGEVCSWTLQAHKSLFVAVSFADFDIGNTAGLSIYNGVNQTSSNLLTTYLGDGPVGTEITFSNMVTLLFRYGYVTIPGRAFALSFASVTPPNKSTPGPIFSACGGDLSEGGKFSSPGYPGWYPNDVECQWTLKAAANASKIQLFFDSFDLESDADFVIVYNGSTTNTTDVRRLSGSLVPFTLEIVTSVIVQFISDPSIGKPGFSARFSSVVPQLPPNLAAACSASCPKTVTQDAGAHCYARDDPHMRTFDGRPYELQKEGLFYLYRHDYAPIWAQVVFQNCPTSWATSATCSCAVAVRYWNEVFVVDRCSSVGIQMRPNRVYKSGNYSMMAITNSGVTYIVRLPNGLSVSINSGPAWIGSVDLRTAVEDRNVVQGVCGLYNGNPNDDDTFRLGYDPQKIKDAWMSWRVPENETLFAPTLPPYPERISSCDCLHVKNGNRLPDGVLSVNAQPVPNTELSNSSQFIFKNDPNPGVINFEDKSWPADWSPDKATTFCNEYVRQRPSIALCQKVAGDALNLEDTIRDCIQDIHTTGGTSFAASALEAAKSDCRDAISSKTEKEQRSVLVLMCPNECSNEGQCVAGVCQCKLGKYGADCSINLSIPPVLHRTGDVQNCPAAQLVNNICYQVIVYGTSFYNFIAHTPMCLVSSKKTTVRPEGTVTEVLPQLRVAAIFISNMDIACPLQIVPAPYNLPFSVNYIISVSNDNSKFSNTTVSAMRGFVPPCGGVFNVTGTLTSPNYPARYYNGANCTWTLKSPVGKSVQLTFTAFSLSQKSDSFRIIDSGLVVDKFSGVEAVGRVINYGQAISVIFTSGNNAVSTGFSIAFISIPSPTNGPCGGQFYGRGSILSPNSPGDYPSDAYCLWILTADSGKGVNLHFNTFNLEENYDNLWVYVLGHRFATFTGDVLSQDFTVPSPAYLVFRSDATNNFSGFNIDFTSK